MTSTTHGSNDDRRRLIIAFALAIAIEEIVAGLIPARRPQAPVHAEVITVARITRIVHRPRPTPKPVVHTHVIAPVHPKPHVVSPAKPSENHHVPRIASARPRVRTIHHTAPAKVHVPMGGHGTGTSTTAVANTGGVGPGGNGTGESGSGNGTGGAPAGQEPCGEVEFVPTADPTVDQSTGRVWEHIAAIVHFPDGSMQTEDLDWTFYYPSLAQDPFASKNLPDPTFQFPPAAKAVGEPALVEYIIKYTTPDGFTRLHECPK